MNQQPIKYKCAVCNKKIRALMLQMHRCRCSGVYCSGHLHVHNCTYEYHGEIPTTAVVTEKIEKI